MELVVFDLDGTLLTKTGEVSAYTRDTLRALADKGVAYTVATGRTLHGTADILDGCGFALPHIYKNGVLIWDPSRDEYSQCSALTLTEIQHVLEAIFARGVSPFVFTLTPSNTHAIYHPPLQTDIERSLAQNFARTEGMHLLPLADIPADAVITNISALGVPENIDAVEALIQDERHLVAYAGVALEGRQLKWIDVHHTDGSKGGAVTLLREKLGLERVICFGDSDNDLSMFEASDECYAPENAKDPIKAVADKVIGHHDEDGIARFLRDRFGL
jgi:Cof subfamily protein (haloacid dehalogenase superfamily)